MVEPAEHGGQPGGSYEPVHHGNGEILIPLGRKPIPLLK